MGRVLVGPCRVTCRAWRLARDGRVRGRSRGRPADRLGLRGRLIRLGGILDVGGPVGPLLHLGVVGQRIAGDERARGVLRVDQFGALGRIRLRQQPLCGHLHELRIAIVGVPIRIGELQGLDEGVEVIGAVVPHRLEIEGLEDVQGLQQNRSLASEGVLVDVVAAIVDDRRLLDLRVEFRKVGELERRLVRLEEGDHLLRDVALVEAIARRPDARGPTLARGGALGLDHPRQRPRQGGQLDRLAGLVHRPVGLQPVTLVVGPVLEELQVALDRLRGSRAQREALLGVFDRPAGDLLEAHGAPALEHGQSGIERAGDHRRVETFAREALSPGGVPVDGGAARRPALADNRDHLAAGAGIDEDQRFPPEAVEILFDDAADQERCHPGIESTAAPREDLERSGRGQGMARGHAGVPAHHRWPLGSGRGAPERERGRQQGAGHDRARAQQPNHSCGGRSSVLGDV